MQGSWLKKLTGFVVAAALLTGIAGTAFAAGANASQSSFLSDYTCDFENNYYPGQGASVVPEGDGNVYRMTVDTNGENHKLEIYNSTLGDFTLTDGNIYAVTLKYKVENISAAEKADSPTVVNIAKSNGTGGIVKIKNFSGLNFYPGDTTEWTTTSVVFKAGIADSPSYNKLAINVYSPTCPSSSAGTDSLKTIILFDDITVTECIGSTSSVEFQSNGGSYCDVVMGNAGDALELPTPERKWYDFGGWYKDSNLTEKFTGSTIPSRITTRLYAKWTPNESAVKLTFNGNGADAPEAVAGGAGEKVTLPSLSRDGFRFAGWYNKELTERYSFNEFPKASLELYAKWELIPQFVGFENTADFPTPNNGTFTQRCKLDSSDPYGGGTSLFYDYDIGTPGNYKAYAGVILIDEHGNKITLEEGVEYAVTFKYKIISCKNAGGFEIITASDGGAWSDRMEQNKSADYVKKYTAADVGKGWQTCTIKLKPSPKSADSNYAYIGISGHTQLMIDNIYVYRSDSLAEFKGNMICFDTAGGTYCETIYGEFGDDVTLPEPTREGYTFLGWSLDENGTEPYTGTKFEHAYLVLHADWLKIQEPEPDTPSQPDGTQSESEPDGEREEGSGAWLYILIAAAAVIVIAGAVTAVVLVKKKKQTAADGEKDKADNKENNAK